MSRTDYLVEELAALDDAGRRRGRRRVEGPQGAHIRLDGDEVINFSSNDYLGLAAHPALRRAATVAIERFGIGAGASRLVVGNSDEHSLLEEELEDWSGIPARLFNSGYAANTGIIAALAGPGDVIFSDALNHASIIDGCRSSRATVVVYRHGDMEDLRHRLSEVRARRCFVVSETVFSMDGDRIDIAALTEVAAERDAVVIADEAHAIGVLGPEGRGAVAESGTAADVVVGTMGKALGAYGAFAWAERAVVEWLWNRARPLVFTTALPPPVVAAARAAVGIVRGLEGAQRRASLRARVAQLVAGLTELGISAAPAAGVVPVVVGDDRRVMECTERLLAQGVFVQGIRPPTVPEGTARLRVTISAAHTQDDVARLLAGLRSLIEVEWIVPRGTIHRGARSGGQL